MNKTALTLGVAFVALAFVVPSGYAGHCNGVVTQIDAGPETLYIDDRSEGAVTINHWIYLESNGVEGLQTGGTAPYPENPVLNGEDPCVHPNGDTIIF